MFTETKMKICFVISSLQSGGAERVVSILANKLSNYFKVYIITWDSTKSFYYLNDHVMHISLDLMYSKKKYPSKIKFNYLRLLSLRSQIKKIEPKLIIGFIITTNILVILASLGLKIPVIVSERSDLFTKKISKIYFKLRPLIYSFADLLVFQTKNALKLGLENNIKAKNNVVIPNPIVISNTNITKKENVILFVGRISKEKQVKDLLTAFSRINNKVYQLWLVGDGKEKLKLEKYALTLTSGDRIKFFGHQKDVSYFYSLAKIFVLPSSSEGFPNVLLEAMSFKNLIICSYYSESVTEIIQNGVNGFLYESGNIDELTNLINNAINNSVKNIKYIKKASDNLDNYSVDNIADIWHKIMMSTINPKNL
jgi:GalNAc-alpha-(1->4)-GalNAc-alpha-(1->3)-diNAcBac-PP-undecaprenol alpha-1,4-N-acetyl-D-galactosaminyltransferase